MRKRTRHDSSTAELLTLPEVCKLYAVGLNSARTLARKANAVLLIGRNVRIVKSRLDTFI